MLNLSWPYKVPDEPSPEELAKEYNGKAVSDLTDATGATLKAGRQLAGFAQLKDDGSTASGCWIFAGSWTEQGNQMARRDNATLTACTRCRTGPGPGRPTAASSTTAPRRPAGKPWDPSATPGVVERQGLGRHRRARLQGRLARKRG
jgi:formate dehydrogenase major subunit